MSSLQNLFSSKLFIILCCSTPILTAPAPVPTTNQIYPPGSPEYTTMVHMSRERMPGMVKVNGSIANCSSLISINGTSSFATSCEDKSTERDKQIRLQSIRDYVLGTIGRGKTPSNLGDRPNLPPIMRPVVPSATHFSGEIKTIYASCDTPNRVNPFVWKDPSYFHLFFNLSTVANETQQATLNNFTLNGNGTNNAMLPNATKTKGRITTISAKLRLYKVGVASASSEVQKEEGEQLIQGETKNDTAAPIVDEKIRVSIYWYKSPVSKTHYRKKLLDTKMVPVKESKWIEFDVINAIGTWIDKTDKNYGLAIEVENEDNERVDPMDYFANIFCPFPLMNDEINNGNGTNNASSFLQTMTPPQLEICVLNTPHPQKEVNPSPDSSNDKPSAPFPGEGIWFLQNVAKSHQKKKELLLNQNAHGVLDLPQNDNVPSTRNATTRTSKHHTRHGHGFGLRRNGKQGTQHSNPTGTTSPFQLDEDHPLRRILATVASSVHNKHFGENSGSVETSSASDESSDRDIIIQKIYIQNPLKQGQQQVPSFPLSTGSSRRR